MFILNNESIEFFRNFKFKNPKYFNSFDGVAYSCELYHNGFKIADILNNGDGGMTDIHYTEKGEQYLNSLDVKKFYSKDLGFSIDNEYILSDLVELGITIKKSITNQSKSIIFFKNNSVYSITYNHKFTDLVKSNKIGVIKDKIKEIEKDGGVVLNTNLTKIGI